MINKIPNSSCCIQRSIPLAFDESLSYLEMICKIINQLNETITQVNSLAEIVDGIDTNFTKIYEEIASLQQQLNTLRDTLMADVNKAIIDNYNNFVQLMNDYQSIFNNELAQLRTDVEEEIKNIELGNVIAYDPTTGTYVNVSTAILNVYDALRYNSITTNEFDTLELTANEFDDKEITAYNFDVNGKLFLMPNN